MLAAWALAAASVQLVQRRPGVLDATHATQEARARATARAARGKRPRSADVHVGVGRRANNVESRKKTYANTAQLRLDFGAACGAVEFACGHSVHTLDYGSPQDHTSPRNSKLKKSRSHKITQDHTAQQAAPRTL